MSQPRKPCERLSHNTKNENTREVIRQSGWTGWYVRVIEEGEIHQGDELICNIDLTLNGQFVV